MSDELIKKNMETFEKLHEETDIDQIKYLPLFQEEKHKIKLDQKHIEMLSSMVKQYPCIIKLNNKNFISADFYLVKSASDIEYLGSSLQKNGDL